MLPGAASRPDYLQNLLAEAARRRDETRPGEPIVLVVDALDEAGTPPGQNVMGLPHVLPKGAYLILSQRPVDVALSVEAPRRVFRLEAGSGDNLADMRAYLEAAATWEGVSQALAAGGHGGDQFIETLLTKCRGVWIYLHYVVGEIESGKRSPLELETLPDGLWQYYAQYWQRWREQEEAWYEVHLPLLSTLAAAQEGLSLAVLCILTGKEEGPSFKRLLDERWRPFLVREAGEEPPSYRLYHASLREFVDGRAELEQLTTTERDLVEELAESTQEAHRRIVDRYLTAWGGLEKGLPGLRKPERRDLDGSYGLRHLVAHLESTRQADHLHQLMRVGWCSPVDEPYSRSGLRDLWDRLRGHKRTRRFLRFENAWWTVKEMVGDTAGYMMDVERAGQTPIKK